MVVSKKIVKENTNLNIESLILRGGTSGVEIAEQVNEHLKFKRMQLRLPLDKLAQIEKQVKERPGHLSRHTWIMEAIEEKLQKDGTMRLS